MQVVLVPRFIRDYNMSLLKVGKSNGLDVGCVMYLLGSGWLVKVVGCRSTTSCRPLPPVFFLQASLSSIAYPFPFKEKTSCQQPQVLPVGFLSTQYQHCTEDTALKTLSPCVIWSTVHV